jgi:tetratricopeptide (TPR) repeat protein
MNGDHLAPDCKFREFDRSGKTRKRRVKKWGYMPSGELTAALTQHAFASRYISWLVYFFRYSYMEEIFKTGSRLTDAKNIYSDCGLIETERLLKMGEEKFKEGAYQEAMVILELVLEKSPQHYRGRITKGYIHIERSEWDQVLHSLGSAVEVAPTNYYRSLTWLIMARVNQCRGEIEEAIIQAQRAICSQLDEAHYFLSVLYIEKGLVDEGLAQLQLAIEENREYLVASCYEPGFSRIAPELNFLLTNIIQTERKRADHLLEKVRVAFQEVEQLEAKLYDPLDFKNARLKYLMATKKHETESYFGHLDANRLLNEAAAYLETAKFASVTRKRLALTKLKEYIQLSLKTGILCGVCAAGWGLVIGGGIGIVMALQLGPQAEYKIITSAIKGAALGFLAAYIYNWRVTCYKKKVFLKQFAKRFRRQRGG